MIEGLLLLFLNQEYNAEIRIILAGRSKERINKRFSGFAEEKDYVFKPYDATVHTDLQVHADYLIHGASNANPVVYAKQPVETMLANIVGINSLLDLAVRMDSRRLLYVSSSEVYGNKSEFRSYVEND